MCENASGSLHELRVACRVLPEMNHVAEKWALFFKSRLMIHDPYNFFLRLYGFRKMRLVF